MIMAIVNRTPDSFYDRGATFTDEAAKAAAHRVIEEGADVVDVGGVKAGPGSDVDADGETARVVPFIEWLRGTFPDQLISVDTWRASVAKQACAAGADISVAAAATSAARVIKAMVRTIAMGQP